MCYRDPENEQAPSSEDSVGCANDERCAFEPSHPNPLAGLSLLAPPPVQNSEDPFGELQYFEPLRVEPSPIEKTARAWKELLAHLNQGDTSDEEHEVPMLIVNAPHSPCVPAGVVRGPVLKLHVSRALGLGAQAGIAMAADELREALARTAERPMIVVCVGLLFSMDALPDSASGAASLIGDLLALQLPVVLVGRADEAQRLGNSMPLHVVRLARTPEPGFLRPVSDELLVGRDDEANQLVELLDAGRSVVVTGAAGTGKTTLIRAVAARPELAGRCYELDVLELMRSTEYRGTFEARMATLLAWAAEQPRCPIILVDELLRLCVRTGRPEEAVADSGLDQLKGVLASAIAVLSILATVTDRELERLRRFDPAIVRRFHEVRLEPLGGDELLEVVVSWAACLDICSNPSEVSQVLELAPQLFPLESSPAREVKLLQLLRVSGDSIRESLRERFGPLALPDTTLMRSAVEDLERSVLGRPSCVRKLEQLFGMALGALMKGRKAGLPLLGAVFSGPRGSGKGWLAKEVAKALGIERAHELPVDRARISSFMDENRNVPGGALIITGTAGPSASVGNGETGAHASGGLTPQTLLEVLEGLNRWVVLVVVHGEHTLKRTSSVAVDGPYPVLFQSLSPVRVRGERAVRLAVRLHADLHERILALGICEHVGHISLDEIEELCSRYRSPAEIEEHLLARFLGTEVPTWKRETFEGGNLPLEELN